MPSFRCVTVVLALGLAAAAGCGRDSAPSAPSPPSPPAPAVIQTIADAPVSDAIVDVTRGSVGTFNFPGQSVRLPPGLYTNLRFQWYLPNKTATAFGTLYLISQEYLGLPTGLLTAPGFMLAASTIENGEYVFDPQIALSGDRTYWFYADKMDHYATSFDIDTYAGGQGYHTGITTQPFRLDLAAAKLVGGVLTPPPPGVTTDNNFRLRGTKQ